MRIKDLNGLVFYFSFLVLILSNDPAIHAAEAAPVSGKAVSENSIFEIDPNHSSVTFRIRHLVSVVKGSFKQFSGELRFDPKVQDSSVAVTIDAASIDTNQEKRDEHLKGADFFDVKKYPEIKFRSKRVSKLNIIGELTLCGVSKEVTLDYIYHGMMNDLDGQARVGFSATGTINRRDFGIVYNKNLTPDVKLLGDEVPIEIEIQAVSNSRLPFQNKPKTADN